MRNDGACTSGGSGGARCRGLGPARDLRPIVHTGAGLHPSAPDPRLRWMSGPEALRLEEAARATATIEHRSAEG